MANFEVNIKEIDGYAGEELGVLVTIENTGSTSGTQTVELFVDPDATETVIDWFEGGAIDAGWSNAAEYDTNNLYGGARGDYGLRTLYDDTGTQFILAADDTTFADYPQSGGQYLAFSTHRDDYSGFATMTMGLDTDDYDAWTTGFEVGVSYGLGEFYIYSDAQGDVATEVVSWPLGKWVDVVVKWYADDTVDAWAYDHATVRDDPDGAELARLENADVSPAIDPAQTIWGPLVWPSSSDLLVDNIRFYDKHPYV